MKLLYKSLLFLMIFICSVGSVCATDIDNITVDNSLSDVNSNNEIVENIEISDVDCSDNLNDNNYCCGAIAFKEVLKENGININLDEAEKATDSVNGSTSMQGIIDGARKYNLSAVGVNINAEKLKTGYIVHMNIDDNSHWAVIKDVTDKIILDDINDNLILPFDEFKQYYTNKSIVISNRSIIDVNGSMLTVNECKELFGGKYAYSYIKKAHYIPANKNPGYAFQIKIVVPKWGGNVIRVTTTKLTHHMICCKVVYKITYYKQPYYKGKPFTINYPCFFNLAMKKGKSFTVNLPAEGVESLRFNWKVSKFP